MKDHVDARKLAAWLKSTGLVTKDIAGEAGLRRVYAWGNETITVQIPYVGTVDRTLTRLGLNESDIPDWVWSDPPACKDCGESLGEGRRSRCPECERMMRRASVEANRARQRERQNKRANWHRALEGLEQVSPGDWRRPAA